MDDATVKYVTEADSKMVIIYISIYLVQGSAPSCTSPRVKIFLSRLPSRGVHFKCYSLKRRKSWLKRLCVTLYFPSYTRVKFQILFQERRAYIQTPHT